MTEPCAWSLSYLLIKSFLNYLSVWPHPLSCASAKRMRYLQLSWQVWVNMGSAPDFSRGGGLSCLPLGRSGARAEHQLLGWTCGAQIQSPQCWKWECSSRILWPEIETLGLRSGLWWLSRKNPPPQTCWRCDCLWYPLEKSCENIRIIECYKFLNS